MLNPAAGAKATICVPAEGDAVALVGDNRRMLVVDLTEIPEMTRGRGVILQRYRSGGLADARMLGLTDGLSWRQSGDRTRTEIDLTPWRGSARRPRPHRAAGLPALGQVRLDCRNMSIARDSTAGRAWPGQARPSPDICFDRNLAELP